tara:strand:- start:95 stop:691 length:597 start_codon:yes stop_codon:yes gene_type:complete
MSFIIFYDLETTGLNPYHNKIIEVAGIKYSTEKKKIIGEFRELVNPKTPISSFITNLTGITNQMVENKDTIDNVITRFIQFCGENNVYLVSHNNDGFDKLFLENIVEYRKIIHKIHFIDTLKLAKKLINNRKSYSLKNLCNYANITYENAHRALVDAKLLYKLYRFLISENHSDLEYLNENDMNHPEHVKKFLYEYIL